MKKIPPMRTSADTVSRLYRKSSGAKVAYIMRHILRQKQSPESAITKQTQSCINTAKAIGSLLHLKKSTFSVCFSLQTKFEENVTEYSYIS